ncbi:MAG: hypothetical protein ABJA80_17825 [bacterium]
MAQQRVDSLGGLSAGVFGAPEAAYPLAPLDVHAKSVADEKPGRRNSAVAIAVRILRDAFIAVALMATVPIGIVAFNGNRVWQGGFAANTTARVNQSEAARPLALARDPSITPLAAGLAFNALQPAAKPGEYPDFPVIESVVRPARTWEKATLTPDMFASAQPDMYQGPSSRTILEAVGKGFTPAEMAYLRTLATAPVWHDFDLVARAPAVDFIGGRLRTPFMEHADRYNLPSSNYKATKALAYAAVSRAAYHMVIGQRDSAETVLRSIVSFGFALVDNGTSVLDELIGTIIVGIGRDALGRFYTITHDPRAGSPAVASLPRFDAPGAARAGAQDVAATRARLIALASNRAARPGERYQSLHDLSVSSCTNVRELVFGPRADVVRAFDDARRTLARSPAERSLVDLIERPLHVVPQVDISYSPVGALAVSSATVAGVVFHNPRMATCALIAGQIYTGR